MQSFWEYCNGSIATGDLVDIGCTQLGAACRGIVQEIISGPNEVICYRINNQWYSDAYLKRVAFRGAIVCFFDQQKRYDQDGNPIVHEAVVIEFSFSGTGNVLVLAVPYLEEEFHGVSGWGDPIVFPAKDICYSNEDWRDIDFVFCNQGQIVKHR